MKIDSEKCQSFYKNEDRFWKMSTDFTKMKIGSEKCHSFYKNEDRFIKMYNYSLKLLKQKCKISNMNVS